MGVAAHAQQMEKCEGLESRREFLGVVAEGKACEVAYTKIVSRDDHTSIRIANDRMICVSENEETLSIRQEFLDRFEEKLRLWHALVGAKAEDSKAHKQVS